MKAKKSLPKKPSTSTKRKRKVENAIILTLSDTKVKVDIKGKPNQETLLNGLIELMTYNVEWYFVINESFKYVKHKKIENTQYFKYFDFLIKNRIDSIIKKKSETK